MNRETALWGLGIALFVATPLAVISFRGEPQGIATMSVSPNMQICDEGKNIPNNAQSDNELTPKPQFAWKSPRDTPENPEDFLRTHGFDESGETGTKKFVTTMNDTDFRKLFGFNYNELNVPPSSWSQVEPAHEVGQYYQSSFDGEWYVQVVVLAVFPTNPDDDNEIMYGKTLEVSFCQKPKDVDFSTPECKFCGSPKCVNGLVCGHE